MPLNNSSFMITRKKNYNESRKRGNVTDDMLAYSLLNNCESNKQLSFLLEHLKKLFCFFFN